MNYKIGSRVLILVLALLFSGLPAKKVAFAQEEIPNGPVYIVQEGDTLWDIAQRFGIPWEELARENGIIDPGQLSAGDEIIIPGYEGFGEVLVTIPVPLGENLRSLSRNLQIPEDTIIKINHLTSSADLYSGFNLVVPDENRQLASTERSSLAFGQSFLELAIKNGVSPWKLVTENNLQSTWAVVPGDVLISQVEDSVPGPGGFPGEIKSFEISPDPLVQGKTTELRIASDEGLELSGSLIEHPLNFFQAEDGDYVALQGVHALTQPGYYSLSLEGNLNDGVPFGFSQKIYVMPGDYTYKSLQVPAETLDPDVTVPEDEAWTALAQPVTPEQLWQGIFTSPVAPSECGYTDTFGHRRSYNGSPYNYFHTGLDFCYNYNNEVNEIYAPADGVVVFAGPLVVRGNAVMINHGQGIYTGYMHQKEILVEEGDSVTAGQVIGIVGGTGRVNGPHLHLEVWAGGVQVDPEDWLARAYP
ncbi:MAG: LysM peptidoglycan-binding domain-containing M23 family metallopeptidase [Anaerolineales bacterium]